MRAQAPASPVKHLFLSLLAALALSACGGGGGDSGASSGGSAGGSSGLASEPVLSGVAAVGAPLGGATITVIDSKGTALGTTTAHAADGSYSLKLSSKNISGAVLVQARGLDATGAPVLLHSAVATPAVTMTANITPLSDAVLALALGTEPGPVFAKAADQQSVLAGLAQLTAASDFLKVLIKTPLSDVKISDAKTLDLLNANGFAANKGSQDLLLDLLRVNLTRNAQDQALLQLSNKFLVSGAAEVVVDLATARTELAKTTGSTPTNAISSTLKATTAAAATAANLATIDDVAVALNQLIAQGPGAIATSNALFSAYDKHNGSDATALATRLAGFATTNWQLSRFQLLGCADDVLTSGNCSRVLVGSFVTDSSGKRMDYFADALSYDTKTKKWSLKGNGRKLDFRIRPLAWLALDAAGAVDSAASSPNPALGVQVLLQAQDSGDAQLLDKATVQTPSGFSLPFAYCAQDWMCVSDTAGATSVDATGKVSDTLLASASVGWLGGADTLRGARYIASFTLAGANETRVAHLPAHLQISAPALARYPVFDGVSSSAPLTAAALRAGLDPSWSGWATANPDLRLLSVKAVIRYADGRLQQREFVVAPSETTRFASPMAGVGPLAIGTPVAFELWLTAQDGAGRRLVSRYRIPL